MAILAQNLFGTKLDPLGGEENLHPRISSRQTHSTTILLPSPMTLTMFYPQSNQLAYRRHLFWPHSLQLVNKASFTCSTILKTPQPAQMSYLHGSFVSQPPPFHYQYLTFSPSLSHLQFLLINGKQHTLLQSLRLASLPLNPISAPYQSLQFSLLGKSEWVKRISFARTVLARHSEIAKPIFPKPPVRT